MDLLPALSVGTLLACLGTVAYLLLHRRDHALEAGMHDPRPAIRDDLRAYLGIDQILTHLHRLEHLMATATEQIAALTSKVDDLTADVRAALAVINQDKLSEPAQAALDELTQKIEAFDAEVGDADGSDVPAEPTA